MVQRPYANLGCGRIILPGEQPAHHAMVDPAIYQYAYWDNIDRNEAEGVDKIIDLFTYPWDIPDNSYDGALLSHLVEHIDHSINVKEPDPSAYDNPMDYLCAFMEAQKLKQELKRKYQGGWYCFMHNLWRVLTPGAFVHILSPYGWSDGAITDPTHTRYLTDRTFTHSMQPDPNSPFEYQTGGINFRMVSHSFGLTPYFAHLAPLATDSPEIQGNKHTLLTEALATRIGVVSDIYVKLEAVK